MRLDGKVVLVTGGGAGIGRALVAEFARRGCRVVACGRDQAKLDRLAADLPGLLAVRCDVALAADRTRLVEAMCAALGRLDILINNAAVQHLIDFAAGADAARIDSEIAVNFVAPIMLVRDLLPLLRQSAEPAIVNLTSPLGVVPKQSAPVYCASKAGLRVFSRALRYQLQPAGIRVFEMLPPLVDTEMTAGRGRGKISAEAAAREIMRALAADCYEAWIGKAKLLRALYRVAPALAARIMRPA